MTHSLLALSLSDSFTKVGAIAAFAALVGIAILSLLFFSQARELKRLREWAGRAPERAAELEQRVSAAAATRVPARPGTQQVRPIPRPAPVNARPITEAPATAMGAANPATASPAAANPATAAPAGANPATAAPAGANPGGAAAAPTPPAAPAQGGPASTPGQAVRAVPAMAESAPRPATAAATTAAAAAAAGNPVPTGAQHAGTQHAPTHPSQPRTASPQTGPVDAPVRAAPAAPGGGVSTAVPAVADAQAPAPATAAALAGASRSASLPRPSAPPAPVTPPPERSSVLGASAPQAAGGSAATAAGRATAPGPGVEQATTLGPRRSYTTKGRSPARVVVLLVAGVVLLVVALVLILSKTGGGSSTANSAHRTAAHARAHARHSAAGSRRTAAAPAGAGATNVVVLNGTSTAGLAHRVAGELRQSGYSQATPMGGSPPGANQVTVVEYASGHQGDAEGIARSLGVGQAQPMEASVASLSGSATVVVIVGLDKAATVP